MRRLTILFATLLLLSTAAPLMACATDGAMGRKENPCCRAKHGDCEEMAKMSCCQVKAHSDERPQLSASAPTITFRFAVVSWLFALQPEHQTVHASRLRSPDAHSPPGLRIARTTVLRI